PDRAFLRPALPQPAREPHLAGRARLPPRLGHHALARPSRAASPRRSRLHGRPARTALTLALVLAAALAVACVVVVALPFLREPETESDSLDDLDEEGRHRLRLARAPRPPPHPCESRSPSRTRSTTWTRRSGIGSSCSRRAIARSLRSGISSSTTAQ